MSPVLTEANIIRWFNELERVSASTETPARILEEIRRIDVRDILPALAVPTIVIHRRGRVGVQKLSAV
jgi:hypothetical protein